MLTSGDVEAAIGRRIRQLRQARQLTQTELAQACGITFQQIQKYERGANRICVSRLMQISRALGVSLVEMLNELDGATQALRDGAATDPQARVVAEAFASLKSRKLRRTLLSLTRVLVLYDRVDGAGAPSA